MPDTVWHGVGVQCLGTPARKHQDMAIAPPVGHVLPSHSPTAWGSSSAALPSRGAVGLVMVTEGLRDRPSCCLAWHSGPGLWQGE